MTVLTKPSIIIKKADSLKSPLVVENGVSDEEKVDIYPPPPVHVQRKRSAGALFCLSVVALVVATAGIGCGVMLYRQYLQSSGVHRYRAFCYVPIESDYQGDADEQLIEPNFNEHREMPLHWSTEPDAQLFGVGDGDGNDNDGDGAVAAANEALANMLREEFDVGARLETIKVYDNGRTVTFLHDFEGNITGIVDQDRCFVMDMEPSLVMAPDRLVRGVERGTPFDVTRVRSRLRALVPEMIRLAQRDRAVREACGDKPVYTLKREGGVIIRKRSVDLPAHDYIQFAGRRVQEIEITNMAQLLQYEQDANIARAAR